MPKETIKEHPNYPAKIEVTWGGFQEHVGITIDRGHRFRFVDITDDNIYDSLSFGLESEEQIDELIKVLKRAKRKTFK